MQKTRKGESKSLGAGARSYSAVKTRGVVHNSWDLSGEGWRNFLRHTKSIGLRGGTEKHI